MVVAILQKGYWRSIPGLLTQPSGFRGLKTRKPEPELRILRSESHVLAFFLSFFLSFFLFLTFIHF